MARRRSKENVMRFMDSLSQDGKGAPSIIGLKYRMPTTEERQGYLDNRQIRDDVTGKLVSQIVENRLNFGAQILTGIEDGSFEDEDAKGKPLPVSSDPDSKYYRKDWKKFVMEVGPDFVNLLAVQVFDGSAVPAPMVSAESGKKKKTKEDVDRD